MNRQVLFQTVAVLTVALLFNQHAIGDEPLRVMSYNLWHGGDAGKQPIDQTVKVIKSANAPIVALQETAGKGKNQARPNRGPGIAKLLGWHYFDQENTSGVVSQYPIIDHTPEKNGVKIELPNKQHLWLFNLHLTARPYQPHQLYKIPNKKDRFVDTADAAIAAAKLARGGQVQTVLREIEEVRDQNAPIFIVGDLNEPSYLDWTAEVVATGRCLLPVAWPTTKALSEAGFVDAYRQIHPNPVTHPGITWTPTVAASDPKDHHDRIDYIFVEGKKGEVKNVEIVGERSELADIVISPYPSDHRALVATVALKEESQASNEEWTPLFNGKDLKGWNTVLRDEPDADTSEVFQVHDGMIHAYKDVEHGKPVKYGFISTDVDYSWFHLKLEYRWAGKRFAPRTTVKRDAGVLFHAVKEEKVWPRCVECQIQEGDTGDCFTVYGARVLTTVNPAEMKKGVYHFQPAADGGEKYYCGGPKISRVIKVSTQEVEGWNTVEVLVRGSEEAIFKVNGKEVFRATDLTQFATDGETWIPLKSGRILLQAEFAEVLYRNVQIKPLAGGPFRVPDPSSAESPIEPATDGSFLLPSERARLTGKSVKWNDRTGAFEDWASNKDRANWKVKNPKMGDYDVAVTWGVSDDDGNQGYKIDVDHLSTIRAFTVSTGGIDKFKREIVGRIMLAPGLHDVTFYPNDATASGGLCKLTKIELIPVSNSAAVAPAEPVEINVPKGFEVEMVAGPPLTSHPMLACFDDRGRLYVAESTGVNADGSVLAQSPPHEIRILEDANGDGRFDKSKVFADKLTFPQGILWHDGAIYASSPPHFWRLRDTDGDDVADEREILATGFPFRGMSDDMHGASLGPDGRIYFATGRFPQKIRRPNGPVIHEGTNPQIVRCRPDGSELEVFCGAMGNAVGTAFTDAGDCFASGTFGVNASGKRDVLNHCVEGASYPVLGQVVNEHKWTGGEMPNLTQFGASASSDLMIYRGETFGPEYRGNLFSALFNMHKISRHILEADGATYRCHNEDFLTSPNADFHPTDVQEDADGSLIVVDTGAWFLIGCPTSVIAKPQLSGAIYRIKRSGAKPPTDPYGLAIQWDKLQPSQLVTLFHDDRFAVRDRAMRTLAAQGETVVPVLREVLNENSPVRIRLNSVWTLARINSPEATAAARLALTDSNEGVRQAAATAAGLSRDRDSVSQLLEIVGKDPSAPARREAATALGRIGTKEAVPSLLSSLSGVTDRFLDHSLVLALIRLDDRERTVAGLNDRSPDIRRGALIALDQMDHGKLSQGDVTRALETDNARVQRTALEVIARHRGWANQITQLSMGWLAEPELSEDRKAALQGVLLAFAKDKSVQQLIAGSLISEKSPQWTRLLLLDVIGRSELKAIPSAWQKPLLNSLVAADAETARAAVTAITAVNQSLEKQNALGREELLSVARNNKQPDDLRVSAAAAGLQPGQDIPADLFELLAAQCRAENPPVTRLAAAGVIGSAKVNAQQRDRVVELVAQAGPLEMPSLVRTFENADSGSIDGKLIQALEKSPGISALPGDRLVKLLEKVPAEIRSEADALLRKCHVDLGSQRKRLDELKDALSGGDPERGRNLFFGAKATCSACHRIGEEGANIGPNLAGIGEIRTRRDLLEAVVFPSASFARNFEPYSVLTTSGIPHSGIISRTTSDSIYLVTPERTTLRIPRSEIEDDGIVPAKISIMPQGLDRILSPQELQDLLAFLTAERVSK